VHRRRQPAAGTPSHAGLSYDHATLSAEREGRRIPLTRLQGAILSVLLREAPRIVAHARLIESAWGAGKADVAALQTQVYELRAVVDRPFAQPLIQSVRGIGYRLAPPP
jgi:DNA-binding response OmpR family regulator